MLKKITVQQLRLGMYLHEFCGSWMAHPFWKKSFLIDSIESIQSIQSSNIMELIIDTQKGEDVLSQSDLDPVPGFDKKEDSHHRTSEKKTNSSASMDMELDRASQVVTQSKQAVCSMFQEARMGNAVSVEKVRSLVEDISDSVSRNAGALIGLVRLKNRDDYTYMHSIAVCALMIALGKQLNLSEEESKDVGMAGLLHDIGKMKIPTQILNKPGKLTEIEFETVKQHPLAGYEMLVKSNSVSPVVLDVCLHHHEKMDGTGYPDNLSGEKINLATKMGAVCDVYDAITSNRPYKKGWCPAESIKKMAEWSKNHFDETVFQAFVRSIGIYPAGSLVMLESGRIGVVVEQSEESLLQPKVRVFFSSKSKSHITPLLLDLSKSGNQDKIVSRELVSKWGFKKINMYWLGEAGAKYDGLT